MITKLKYDKQGKFELTGSIDVPHIDFNAKLIENKNFFQLMINTMINIKKNVLKQLSDDNKITGDERIEVMKAIDKFLTLVFGFALIVSSEDFYSDRIRDTFEIRLEYDKMKYLKGSGVLYYKILKNIIDFDKWIEENIINVFKRMLAQFNEKGDKIQLKRELILLIYNTFTLRYKMEYI